MTYCVGVLLDSGLVLASDSRTNAGVDQIGTFRKMTVYERPGDRVIVLLSSGNLAVTQAVVSLLEQRVKENLESLWTIPSLYQAACLVGETLREVHKRDGPHLRQHNIDVNAGFILGGQISGEKHRLFNIYSEGNFIEATPDTPYLQNGELKYGKPILDRVITSSTTLTEAGKCVLVSFDSTMRSNISVGLPFDLLFYERDSLKVGFHRRFMDQDPYFDLIRKQWQEGLRRLLGELPDPHWEG
jgi:putative proteasome-type protease